MKQFLLRLLTAVLFFSSWQLQNANAQTTVTIGGTGTTTSYNFPHDYAKAYNYSQSIYTKAEITATTGTSNGGTITKIRFKPKSNAQTTTWKEWAVYLGNTSKSSFTSTTDWVPVSSMTKVFDGTLPANVTANSWMEITLAPTFFWYGTDNLVVAIHEKTAGAFTANPNWAGYYPTGSYTTLYYSEGTNPNPASPPTASGRTSTNAQFQFLLTPPSPCSGTPTASISSSVNSVCAGTPFTLTAGPIGFTGITYQFQSSANGTTWNNLGLASTNNTYTINSQTAAAYYRVQAKCGTMTGNSPSVLVAQGVCYCTPSNINGSSYYINNFKITGGIDNINNNSSGTATGYTDFSATVSGSAYQGTTINFSMTATPSSYGNLGRAIWIDYNNDGVFQTAERVANSTSYVLGEWVGSFTIPSGTPAGPKRMRIVANGSYSNPTDPCIGYISYNASGEFEDYTFNVLATTPCSGTPAAATATASVSSVCPGTAFTLNASNLPGPGVTGITYQWQSKPVGSGSWANISGATTVPYTVSTQAASTEYRLNVICSGSNTSSSNVVTVNKVNCYCTPTNMSGSSYYITNLTTTGGTTNINNNSGGSASGYTDFSGSVSGSAYQGVTVNFSMNVYDPYSYYSYGRAIWIDYNDNGVFETNERVANTTNYVGGEWTGSFTIPPATTAGPKRMRIVANYSVTNPNDPCTGSTYTVSGEFEDYTFTVLATTPCSGTPATAAASASVANACAGTPFTLNATNIPGPGVTGITYQWQSKPAGSGSWANISGATTMPYTVATQTVSTEYRLAVICSGGGTSYSNTLSIGQNPVSECHCQPSTTTAATHYISKFETTGGITNITNTSGSSGTAGYQNFYNTAAASAYQGASLNYKFTVTGSSYYYRAIWVDFNEDGDFDDANELVVSPGYSTYYSPITGSFTIPNNITPGTKRMRVLAGYSPNPTSPCTYSGQGEYEDYKITIVATPPPTITSFTPSSGCNLTEVTITGTNFVGGAANITVKIGSTEIYYGTLVSNTSLRVYPNSGASGPITVITPFGSATSTGSFTYTLPTAPTTATATPNEVFVGQSFSLSAGVPSGNWIHWYTVASGGSDFGYTPATGSQSRTENTPGTYTYYAETQTYEGCASTTRRPVTVTVKALEITGTTPATRCGNGTVTLSATASAGAEVKWYDQPTGGTVLFTGNDFTTPELSATTTYYAEPAYGALAGDRVAVVATVNPADSWTGLISSDWSDADNWCGGIPTATTDRLIPGSSLNQPEIPASYTAAVNNLTLDGGTLTVNGTLNLHGDLSYVSGGSMDATAGTLNLAGTGLQILPSAPLVLRDVAITGPGHKTLTNDLTITGGLHFENGLLVLQDAILTLQSPAAITFNNDASYILTDGANSGLRQQVISTGTAFIVGKSTQQQAVLLNNANDQYYTVRVSDGVLEGGATGTPVNSAQTFVVDRTWHITPDDPANADVDLALYWLEDQVNSMDFDPSRVYIAHHNGTEWENLSGLPAEDASPAAEVGGWYIALQENVTAFSPFTVGSGAAPFPLPVALTGISARNEGSSNRIEWQSGKEANVSHYEIEKSRDGKSFNYLSKTEAMNQPFGYITYDDAPFEGLTYYRLKMIDKDGSFAYSKVVSAFMKGKHGFAMSAFPNPAATTVRVKVAGGVEGAQLQLTDLSGRVIARQEVVGGEAQFDVRSLASGVYFIKYADEQRTETIKVNKQ